MRCEYKGCERVATLQMAFSDEDETEVSICEFHYMNIKKNIKGLGASR